MSTPESEALNAVCEYLHMQGYFFFRVNNVGIFDPTKNIHRKMPKWCVKGISDVMVIHRGKTYYIEVKSATGKLSPDQEAFQAMVEENDGDYYIARGVEDIQRIFPHRA